MEASEPLKVIDNSDSKEANRLPVGPRSGTPKKDENRPKDIWIKYTGVGLTSSLWVFPMQRYVYYGSPGGAFKVRLTWKNELGQDSVF